MSGITIKTASPATVYQVNCVQCGASYGQIQSDEEDAPVPRFCAFCASRADFTHKKVDAA